MTSLDNFLAGRGKTRATMTDADVKAFGKQLKNHDRGGLTPGMKKFAQGIHLLGKRTATDDPEESDEGDMYCSACGGPVDKAGKCLEAGSHATHAAKKYRNLSLNMAVFAASLKIPRRK